MKVSKYCIFHKNGDKLYIYHQLSETLLDIDNELYHALSNKDETCIPLEISAYLSKKGILIDDNINECDNICYANLKNRYNSKTLRVTILPTLNCNFRCWYCYEQHKPSALSSKSAMSIINFIKKEVKEKNIENILLDWFGGEPLLYFTKIIYPISKEIKTWSELHNINFSNIITTNGSLINDKMITKMEEIGLRQFQITLDGDKEHHNQTRFSENIKNSYRIIVKNIHSLCSYIKNANIELRINYTTENIDSTFSILDSFEPIIRKNILISPHIVWQESNKIENLSHKITELKNAAYEKGYCIHIQSSSHKCMTCYTENMEQFVINYDMNVYKCTAREFDKKFSIGKISTEGDFIPNNLYYKYYITQSPFMREDCLKCELLPSCMFSLSCIQKKIEKNEPKCDKESILSNIKEEINYKISQKNKHA